MDKPSAAALLAVASIAIIVMFTSSRYTEPKGTRRPVEALYAVLAQQNNAIAALELERLQAVGALPLPATALKPAHDPAPLLEPDIPPLTAKQRESEALVESWIDEFYTFDVVPITIDDFATQEERDRFWGWHDIRLIGGFMAISMRWDDGVKCTDEELESYMDDYAVLAYISFRSVKEKKVEEVWQTDIYNDLDRYSNSHNRARWTYGKWRDVSWEKPISDATIEKFGGDVSLYGGQLERLKR